MTSRNKVFIVAKDVLNVNVRHDVKHRLCQFDVIHCIVQRITIHLHAKRCRNRCQLEILHFRALVCKIHGRKNHHVH